MANVAGGSSSWPIRLMLVATGCVMLQSASGSEPGEQVAGEREYWLARQEEFREKTRFELPESSRRLLGGKYSHIHQAHLPFWFDYELFKRVFHQTADRAPAQTQAEERERHNLYISNCMKTLKKRVLFSMLAGVENPTIGMDADRFHGELEASRAANSANANNRVQDNEQTIQFAIQFVHRNNAARQLGSQAEDPVARAVRLIVDELAQVESKNQVNHYLRAFSEQDGSAIGGQLPY